MRLGSAPDLLVALGLTLLLICLPRVSHSSLSIGAQSTLNDTPSDELLQWASVFDSGVSAGRELALTDTPGQAVNASTYSDLVAAVKDANVSHIILQASFLVEDDLILPDGRPPLTVEGDSDSCIGSSTGLCELDGNGTTAFWDAQEAANNGAPSPWEPRYYHRHFVVCEGCSLTVRNLGLIGGRTTIIGGASIFMHEHSTLTVLSCIFQNNEAGDYTNPYYNPALGEVFAGGAIRAGTNSMLIIRDSQFVNASAPWGGGAISLMGEAVITNTVFDGCSNDNSIGMLRRENLWPQGGAIWMGSFVFGNIDSPDEKHTLLLDGCNFTGSSKVSYGGAIKAEMVSVLHIKNSNFVDNFANYQAGAMYLNAATAVIEDSTFVGNVAGGSASGVYIDSSKSFGNVPAKLGNVTVKRCTFDSNQAIKDYQGTLEPVQSGGGLYATTYPGWGNGVHLSVEDSTFVNNYVSGSGGGIWVDVATILTVTRCTFIGNGAAARGGAIGISTVSAQYEDTYELMPACLPTSLVVTGGEFRDNYAGEMGGAIFANNKWRPSAPHTLSVVGAHFVNNTAGQTGGAILIHSTTTASVADCEFEANGTPLEASCSATGGSSSEGQGPIGGGAISLAGFPGEGPFPMDFQECSFSGNVGLKGGAVSSSLLVNASFHSCAFTGNNASVSGGAFYLDGPIGSSNGTATTFISDSVMEGNDAPDGAVVYVANSHSVFGTRLNLTNNTAVRGAGGFLAYNTSSVLLKSAVVAGNVADAGGVLFLQSGTPGGPLPSAMGDSCDPCVVKADTVAYNYGQMIASPPVSFTVSAPTNTTTGAPLPIVVTVLDAYGSTVKSWPTIFVSVESLRDPNGTNLTTPMSDSLAAQALSGISRMAYGDSSATFTTLSLTAPPGFRFLLRVTVSDPSVYSFTPASGRSVQTFPVVISQCRNYEFFDNETSRCTCTPNSARVLSSDMDSTMVALAPCICGNGYYADNHTSTCKRCDDETTECYGGIIYTREGYWRPHTQYPRGFRCRPDRCLAELDDDSGDDSSPLPTSDGDGGNSTNSTNSSASSSNSTAPAHVRRSRRQLVARGQIPPSFGHNCVEGTTGPLCENCLEGYAVQGDECIPCNQEDSWERWDTWAKAILIAFCALGGMIAIFCGFFLVLMPHVVNRFKERFRRAPSMPPTAGKSRLKSRGPARSSGHKSSTTGTPGQLVPVGAAAGAAAAAAAEEEEETDESDVMLEAWAYIKLGVLMGIIIFQKNSAFVKIIINFLQIAMSLLRNLPTIPWPSIFKQIASRLSAVNIHILTLPKMACLHPEPEFYDRFNGQTLGLAGALGLVAMIHSMGRMYYLSKRGQDSWAKDAYMEFKNRTLSAGLWIMYLAYPSVCETVMSVFSCQELPQGDGEPHIWYLRADYRAVCYSSKHKRYIAAGIFWVIMYPAGIPYFFYQLLRTYQLPYIVERRNKLMWLQHAVRMAAMDGLEVPRAVDLKHMDCLDIIPDKFLRDLQVYIIGEERVESFENPQPFEKTYCCCITRKVTPKPDPRPLRDRRIDAIGRWVRNTHGMELHQNWFPQPSMIDELIEAARTAVDEHRRKRRAARDALRAAQPEAQQAEEGRARVSLKWLRQKTIRMSLRTQSGAPMPGTPGAKSTGARSTGGKSNGGKSNGGGGGGRGASVEPDAEAAAPQSDSAGVRLDFQTSKKAADAEEREGEEKAGKEAAEKDTGAAAAKPEEAVGSHGLEAPAAVVMPPPATPRHFFGRASGSRRADKEAAKEAKQSQQLQSLKVEGLEIQTRSKGRLRRGPNEDARTGQIIFDNESESEGEEACRMREAVALDLKDEHPLETIAMARIGFLIKNYRVGCWYWEIVELLRKFFLTSILTLVSPGTVAQITYGCLMAFGAVLLFGTNRPYAELKSNSLGMWAQVDLFLFIFVALLLKVKVDETDPDGTMFNAFTGVLSIFVPVFPFFHKLLFVLNGEDLDEAEDGTDEMEASFSG